MGGFFQVSQRFAPLKKGEVRVLIKDADGKHSYAFSGKHSEPNCASVIAFVLGNISRKEG